MAFKAYYREDVAQVLDAVDSASGGTAALIRHELDVASRQGGQLDVEQLGEHLHIYRQGYQDALTAVARAFGLMPRSYAPNWDVDPGKLPLIEKYRLHSWGS